MTHSNHRRGSRESLEKDFVVLTTDGRRHKDIEKHTKYTKILLKHNPIGINTSTYDEGEPKRLRYMKGWDKSKNSGMHEAYTLEEINACKTLRAGSAIFANIEDVKGVLQDLKDADLGIATVFSGIFDEVHKACGEVGTGPHTVNMSAGSFGRTDLLPEPKILEITTMCGHHMPNQYLVKHLIERVRRKNMTAKDAAVEIAKQCTCNFLNVVRAEELINEYLSM
jgi:hypothetical protein